MREKFPKLTEKGFLPVILNEINHIMSFVIERKIYFEGFRALHHNFF